MGKLTIVTYHYVRPIAGSAGPRVNGLELDDFIKQLDYFATRYHFVSVDAVHSKIYSGKKLPQNPLLLTFDDGYIDHYQYVYPELLKRSITGAFFPVVQSSVHQSMLDVNKIHLILASDVTSDLLIDTIERNILPSAIDFYRKKYFYKNEWDGKEIAYIKRLLQFGLPEKMRHSLLDLLFAELVSSNEAEYAKAFYMNIDQMREMSVNGMHIGSHTASHRRLSLLTGDELESEIVLSLALLNKVNRHEISTICYPHGDYNRETLACLPKHGVSLGFSLKKGVVDFSHCNPLELERFDTNDMRFI